MNALHKNPVELDYDFLSGLWAKIAHENRRRRSSRIREKRTGRRRLACNDSSKVVAHDRFTQDKVEVEALTLEVNPTRIYTIKQQFFA